MDEQAHPQTPFRKRRITNPRLRRGIFLLPSLFTVANLLCGYYAVVASLVGGADSLIAPRKRSVWQFYSTPWTAGWLA